MRISKIKLFQNFNTIKGYAEKTGIKLRYFCIPALLSLLAAVLEGVGLALLLPLAKALLEMNFDFIQETKAMQFIMHNIFHVYSRQHTFIFVFIVTTIMCSMILSNVMRYLAMLTTRYQLRKFSDKLRRLIFDRYLSFGKLFFDRHNLGYLHNILINYVNQIAVEFYNLEDAFSRFFMLVMYLVIMFSIEARLTILILLILPLLHSSARWLISKIKRSSSVYASFSQRINEQIFNILSCVPLVKIYAREEREKEAFSKLSDNLRRAEFSIDKKTQLVKPLNEILVLVIVILFISLMTFMVTKEKIGQVSSFLVFFIVLKRASNSFYFLTIVKNSLAAISGPVAEIKKIFNL
jgi:ABC-type multidrug transport system fused ATPase/permease subunit